MWTATPKTKTIVRENHIFWNAVSYVAACLAPAGLFFLLKG